MTFLRARTTAVALLCGLWAAPHLQGQDVPPDLDRVVARVMRTFEVPGIALAVVRDGRTVVARGYGLRRQGSPAPVDAHTRFAIASNTKAFTATALGLLVEEGLLEWDAPVVRYVPWFAMWDPWVTQHITVRDLLVHRSGLGLGAGDLLWWPPSTYDRKEIAYRLRYLRPATSFRSAYAYDNVLYGVAGEVIEAVSGMTWEAFVASRMLGRIGMTDSYVLPPGTGDTANTAAAHARVDGVVRPVTPFISRNLNPAGGIHASATDMARWLRVQLDSGRLADDSRLYEASTARELWAMVVPRDPDPPPPELAPLTHDFQGYALGFNVLDYRGEKLVTHTGGLPGFVSRVAMLPNRGVGVAVLTNMESGAAFNALTWYLLDHYLGAPDHDWVEAYAQVERRAAAALTRERDAAAEARNTESTPSLPLPAYAGTYRDAWYGDIEITEESGGLVIRFTRTPSLVGDLTHWQYDTFLVRWRDRELRADAFVTFALEPDGSIRDALMRPASSAVDFSFDFQDLRLLPVVPRH